MILRDQSDDVKRLSLLAGASAAETSRIGSRIRNWRMRHVRIIDTLAWPFAAGAWWGAAPQPGNRVVQAGRGVFRLMSAGLLVWRLLDRNQTRVN